MKGGHTRRDSHEIKQAQGEAEKEHTGKNKQNVKQPKKAYYISLRNLNKERKESRSRSESKNVDNEQITKGRSSIPAGTKLNCFDKIKDAEETWKSIKDTIITRPNTGAPSSPKLLSRSAN